MCQPGLRKRVANFLHLKIERERNEERETKGKRKKWRDRYKEKEISEQREKKLPWTHVLKQFEPFAFSKVSLMKMTK